MSKHLSIKQFAQQVIREVDAIALEMGYKFDENDIPIPVGGEPIPSVQIHIHPSHMPSPKSQQSVLQNIPSSKSHEKYEKYVKEYKHE